MHVIAVQKAAAAVACAFGGENFGRDMVDTVFHT
jgi:hypothetical protein